MNKNSVFLNHILNYAKGLAESNDDNISNNYILLACIDYFREKNPLGEKDLTVPEVNKDIIKVKNMLYGHLRKFRDFGDVLYNFIMDNNYDNLQSTIEYLNIKYKLEKDPDHPIIEAYDYINYIFNDSTDQLLYNLILNFKPKSNKGELDTQEYSDYLDYLNSLTESFPEYDGNEDYEIIDDEDDADDDIDNKDDTNNKDEIDNKDKIDNKDDIDNDELSDDLKEIRNYLESLELKEVSFTNGKPNSVSDDSKKENSDKNNQSFFKWTDSFDDYLSDEDEEVTESEEENKSEEEILQENKDSLSALVEETKRIRDNILGSVFGQDYAVNELINGYFQAEMQSRFNKKKNKPKATFLFAGPPGVGKTFLASKFAEELNLPFGRFDMSEYCDKEASIEFIGSDNVYRDGKRGNFTSFVETNTKSVILFDEIEKAHITIIYLFLQILDAGRIRDNFTDTEIDLSDCILIFTTNAGKALYDNVSANSNLSIEPKRKILNSLTQDINPVTGEPLFPGAITSRFSGGNIIMFNHLEPHNLLKIINKELVSSSEALKMNLNYDFDINDNISSVILFSQGGKADARNVTGKAANLFNEELFELLRLVSSDLNAYNTLEKINYKIKFNNNESVNSLFNSNMNSNILVFSDKNISSNINNDNITIFYASNIEEAKDILFDNDITIILCDVMFGLKEDSNVLNIEDIESLGIEFLNYSLSKFDKPLYVLINDSNDLSHEETISLIKLGAKGFVCLKNNLKDLTDEIIGLVNQEYVKNNIIELAKTNKVLTYKSSQKLSNDGKEATIELYDLNLVFSPDAKDANSLVNDMSRPTLKFDDVIGANDAKDELKYFSDYLINPIKFMRKGVKAPKGILLYGPPGTGKTLLAKAMAGESKVTFITIEGNRFLKKNLGEGPEYVHKIFALARKYAPSIIFVDEIDVIARDRLSTNINSGDVLTAFLTEMDGFTNDSSKPIFVLAATNYNVDPNSPHALDGALLRRFDRKIYIDLPNKHERIKYLEMKFSKSNMFKISNSQIENISVRSTGMSLAILDNIIEFSKREAIRKNQEFVTDKILENAFETYTSGEVNILSEDFVKRTAIHESGHALISFLCGIKPSYLTIVSRGDHGGYLLNETDENKGGYTKTELLNQIKISLAGRAAEIVYYGEEEGTSTGPSSDLANATGIAERMICYYGMNKSFGVSVVHNLTNEIRYSKEVRNLVNEMLSRELQLAIDLIKENKVLCDELVNALLDRNYLKSAEIEEILNKK